MSCLLSDLIEWSTYQLCTKMKIEWKGCSVFPMLAWLTWWCDSGGRTDTLGPVGCAVTVAILECREWLCRAVSDCARTKWIVQRQRRLCAGKVDCPISTMTETFYRGLKNCRWNCIIKKIDWQSIILTVQSNSGWKSFRDACRGKVLSQSLFWFTADVMNCIIGMTLSFKKWP